MITIDLEQTFTDLNGDEIGSFKRGYVFEIADGEHRLVQQDGKPVEATIYVPGDAIIMKDVICRSLITPNENLDENELISCYSLMTKIQSKQGVVELTDENEISRIRRAVFNAFRNQPMIVGQVNDALKGG